MVDHESLIVWGAFLGQASWHERYVSASAYTRGVSRFHTSGYVCSWMGGRPCFYFMIPLPPVWITDRLLMTVMSSSRRASTPETQTPWEWWIICTFHMISVKMRSIWLAVYFFFSASVPALHLMSFPSFFFYFI